MDAIILAAGRGSRMKDLTHTKPKCLLQLGGKTLLEWQTKALTEAGISNIHIVRGYKKETLQDPSYFYVDNLQWRETNMVYSLFCAYELLQNQTLLISYSDIVYHSSIIKTLIDVPGDLVISYDENWESLWRERFSDPLVDAETFQLKNGILAEIGRKSETLNAIEGQYMGLLKISPKRWSEIYKLFSSFSKQKQKSLDITSFLQELVEQNIPIVTAAIQGKWCEVDRMEDLLLYQNKLNNRSWMHDWR